MTRKPIQLNYGRPKPLISRRRLGVSALVAILLSAGYVWGPEWWENSEMMYRTWQCKRYTAPANQVMYEEDPIKAAALVHAGRGIAIQRFGQPDSIFVTPPAYWQNLLEVQPYGKKSPFDLVFLHERSAGQAAHRLVAVGFVGWHELRGWDIQFRIIRPDGTSNYYFTILDISPDTNISSAAFGSLRLFAGQADPRDDAHFTIGYELRDQPGTIDGWLEDGDTVRLRVRDVPAKLP